jgi:hypothetical protein
MVVIVLALLLILGIAFYQVTQGLFSALIMTALTVLCAGVAIGNYEALAAAYLYARQPAYADAIMLVALFVLPLLALRMAVDWLVKGNIVLGMWADRIGGGALGLITGMTIVGVLLIAMQMLPFGASVLGFAPFDDTLQRSQGVFPFYPDQFVLGMGEKLSVGGLSTEQRLDRRHSDLFQELFCARNTAGKNGRVDGKAGHTTVQGIYELPADALPWMDDVPLNPCLDQTELRKTLVVRVAVNFDAREAKSDDVLSGWWLLPGTHFRLVCETPDGPRDYYPVGFLTHLSKSLSSEPTEQKWKCFGAPVQDDRTLIAKLIIARPPPGKYSNERKPKDATELVVDWVYQIAETDKPGAIVFRRVDTPAMPEVKAGPDALAEMGTPEFAAKALDRAESRYIRRKKKL